MTVTWLAFGLPVLAVVILTALVLVVLPPRIRALLQQAERLQARTTEVDSLRDDLERLSGRAAEVQATLSAVQRSAAAIRPGGDVG